MNPHKTYAEMDGNPGEMYAFYTKYNLNLF